MSDGVELSSFFATSFANLKAQAAAAPSPVAGSRLTAPTAEERQLLNCNSYGTFAIPFGTFRHGGGRNGGGGNDEAEANSFYRHNSVLLEASVSAPLAVRGSAIESSNSGDAESPSVASTGSTASSSASSSVRGLASCRESYADYGAVSILGGRWGSGAYQFENSGRALVRKAVPVASAVRRAVALPALPRVPRSPQYPQQQQHHHRQQQHQHPQQHLRNTMVKLLAVTKAPTPPPVNIDFSKDDEDELLPYENRTQQFFRLAQEHREKRVKAMKKLEKQKRHNHAHERAVKTSPATVLLPPRPPRAPNFQPCPESPDAPHSPMVAMWVASQRPQNPAQPPERFLAQQHQHARQRTTRASTVVDIGHSVDSAWLTPLPYFPLVEEEDQVRASSVSSSASSDSSRSDSVSSDRDDAIAAEDRELWGICPRRDFPFVLSPKWSALEGGHSDSSEYGSSAADSGSSSASSRSRSTVSSSSSSDSDDDGDSVEVIVATAPVEAAYLMPLPPAAPRRVSAPTPASKRQETSSSGMRTAVWMYALKVHGAEQKALGVQLSNATANSTANLSSSSSFSASDGISSCASTRDSRATPDVAVQSRQQRSEDMKKPQQQPMHNPAAITNTTTTTKILFRPRSPLRAEEKAVPRLRCRRANGFRRIFKGLF